MIRQSVPEKILASMFITKQFVAHTGMCDKSFECFYRHPADEEETETRKRTLSDQMSHQMPQSNKSQKTSEGINKIKKIIFYSRR